MKVTITIECDNAAFGDTDASRHEELAHILKCLAHDLYGQHVPQKLRDSNGNTVGTVVVSDE